MPQESPCFESDPATRDLLMNVNSNPEFSHPSVLDGTHSDKESGFQSCLQCHQCPSHPQECVQASCLIPEITPECTDQCLVVACDDPDHSNSQCQVTSGDKACDGSCVSATDCMECPGLEEILQCCTDYHPYSIDPRAYNSTRMVQWDNTLSDILCRREDGASPTKEPFPQDIYYRTIFPSHPMSVLRSESSATSSNCTTPSPLLSASGPHSPISTAPLNSVQMHTCLWADCHLVFSSLTELVGHVNLQHLRITCLPATGQSNVPPTNNTSLFGEATLSCHWGNCAMFPSPSSIPSSSSGGASQAIDVLTAHLMQDHLGMSSPFRAAATAPPALLGPPVISSSTSQELPSPHELHVCRWQSCSQSFACCDELTTHIATVHIGSGKAHYDCFWEGCPRNGDKGFSSKQKISRHLQSHTGHRPFQCKICLQNFSEAATLQQHMRRHTQEKPYLCDYPGCGKAFAITGALTIHKRTHNGQRPFKCPHCAKAFSESSNLSKHLRTHTGARPYVCTERGCKKSFARPDQLTRHMSVHRKKSGAVAGSS